MIQLRRRKTSGTKAIARGLAAGVAATWLMNRVTAELLDRQPRRVRRRERRARGGESSHAAAAKRVADVAGRKLSKDEAERAGAVLQWGLGLGAAAGYALLRRRFPGTPIANGLLYGTLFWALVDEGVSMALGVAPAPRKFPWQTHARGLAGHVAFGMAADRTLRALERAR